MTPFVENSEMTSARVFQTTLALDPATGEMQWYFQHIPGDSHDMDETFEHILVDYDGKQSVFSMGKLGISGSSTGSPAPTEMPWTWAIRTSWTSTGRPGPSPTARG